jgi:electron-transferring-flavoprotein dehydrogenase
MHHTDVAIVGGGPAGSTAGYAAAREGADTVVIEKGVPREDRDGLGPDSTDAAGILDYWVDIMDLDEPVPEHVKHRELSAAEFIGPSETLELTGTGIDASYPNFGFTMHRAEFDDWLRERAENAGAEYRIGTAVADVESDLTGEPSHTLTLRDGTEIQTTYLILADGPQRTITGTVLERWLSEDRMEQLSSRRTNHIAYQEYREMPEELFEGDRIKFWWGYMPGHTAYPWVFPNDGAVARVGLTMPINLDLDTVENRSEYRLLHPEDERIPQGNVYIERLLETAYPEYDLDEFPIQKDRGKAKGTETYPISSTRPIESPTRANVAIVGGAMGATSAFHEGGDHVAIRSGSIAGRLAGLGAIRAYNAEWHRAIGSEIRRNCIFAEMVRDHRPGDWDRLFGLVNDISDNNGFSMHEAAYAGWYGAKLFATYRWKKFGYRKGRYAQVREDDYVV